MSEPKAPQAKKQSDRPYSWLLLIVSAVVILLIAEVGVRVLAHSFNKARGAIFDSELGWRLVPGITKENLQWSRTVPAKTNSDGWRDSEFSRTRNHTSTRIVALGDSFTFGFGVDYGERFSEELEKLAPNIQVMNLGVFAYGTDQESRVYDLHGIQLSPDIVLLNVYLGNDLDDLLKNRIHCFPKPYFVPHENELKLVKPSLDLPMFLRTHSYLMELVFQVLKRGKLESTYADELVGVDKVELFIAVVRQLSGRVRAAQGKFLVAVIHPRTVTDEEGKLNARVVDKLRAINVDVLDLQLPFTKSTGQANPSSFVELYLSDGHWNPAGHRLAARLMYEKLFALGWIR